MTMVLCIGAGSGGCASAMRSADLGKGRACGISQERYRRNMCYQGCIPTKVLLQSARVYQSCWMPKIRCCSAGGTAGFESSPSEEIRRGCRPEIRLDNMLIKTERYRKDCGQGKAY